MKIRVPQKSPAGRSRDAGFALVIVLSVLVLVVALAIAFLNRATTERSAAAGYSSLISARQLSESAVGLVQSQINLATLQGQDVAWASQPGMIRTFDNSGNLKEAFKLYSAPAMIGTTIDPAAEVAKIADWTVDTARWTDLNAPVVVPVDGVDEEAYPILDPAAIDTTPSEGLASEGAIDQFTIDGAPTTPDQSAPMPVEWLYVLEDGSFQAATGSGTVADVPTADENNSIVGRIAFWTDDDTSKVNINTASEGAYWDTPRVQSRYDRDLATYQPARNEFQRYPGHPAMTSLSAVLPAKSSPLTFDSIYSIAPRVQAGGSNVQVSNGAESESETTPSNISQISDSLTLDGDRLYASVDELLFNVERNSGGSGPNLDKADLESAKFFLTANSRAPEVNLFNLPRIAMWPIHATDSDATRNATDRLLAFVSTLDGEPYFFQRKDRRSATADYAEIARNRDLYAYLQGLSGRQIPGFGGSFANKYPLDRNQILTEMFDYIRITNLRDTTVSQPYGGTNQARRGSIYTIPGNGQVVPIRIPSNSGGGPSETKGFGRFPLVSEASIMFVGVGKNDGGASPVGVASGQRQAIGTATAPDFAGYDNATQPQNTTQVLAIFVLQFFVPAMGWSDYNSDFLVEIEGLDSFRLGGAGLPAESMGFPARGSVWVSNNDLFHGRMVGGTVDWRSMVADRTQGATSNASLPKTLSYEETEESRFPFFSKIFDIPNNTGETMSFEGGRITIRIYSGQEEAIPPMIDSNRLVQTIEMEIPVGPTTLPVPGLSPANGRLVGTEFRQDGRSPSVAPFDRFDTGPVDGTMGQLHQEDVVRSMVLAGGDPRIVSGRNVPASAYVPHEDWTSTSHFAHGLVAGVAFRPFAGRTSGRLVEGLTYKADGVPIAPKHLNGAFAGGSGSSVPGDWDTGLAHYSDGGYINKPDEGNIEPGSTAPYFDNSQEFQSVSRTFFTPNRQIPSAGMFGSLSTGVNTSRPWQTLLFRPDPSGQHPGAKGRQGDGSSLPGAPADHLWMDLFWMPIVEPYPISEPMSTAGKVNMNYQIMPFTYINRDSSLRAVLKAEQVMVLDNADALGGYKAVNTNGMLSRNPRESLNLSAANGTLRQFKKRFDDGDIFRSATEICDVFLVPQGQNWTTDAQGSAFWNSHLLTGDNLRERPYTNIYPRLTTKSNTYTVHYKAQALKNPGTNQAQWDEATGVVEAEYRGSTTIERYVDLDAVNIDFATSTSTNDTLNDFYKWRVLASQQFAP